MTQDYQTALSLMAIGMITVAFILLVVVSVGNIIIRVTNSIKVPPSPPSARKSAGVISDSIMAAIVGAVSHVTHGRGKVTGVEKMK